MLDVVAIRNLIPHRFPMLLVDRVLELESGQRAVAIKNVTVNEPFFTGHYPKQPVMPGVLIMEALAQVGGIALSGDVEAKGEDVVPLLAGIDKARFRRRVVPGDQLKLEVNVIRAGRRMSKIHGRATVDGEVAAEAEMLFGFITTAES